MCSKGYSSWVCQSVSSLVQNSPLEHLLILKTTYSTGNRSKKICKVFLWNYCVQLRCETRAKSQYANEYCLTSTGLCRFAYCGNTRSYSMVKSWVKGCIQVMSQRLHSNATYKYSYPVGVRNVQLCARGCGLYACVYIAVVCVYNLVHVLHMRNRFALYMCPKKPDSLYMVECKQPWQSDCVLWQYYHTVWLYAGATGPSILVEC